MLKDILYLSIIVAIPLPTFPLVILFFNSNNLIYSGILYLLAIQVIYLSIYFLCKYFRLHQNTRKMPNIFPAKLRRIKSSFVDDLLQADLLKIISVLNIIQIPLLAVAFIFGYYKTKLSSVILHGIYVGLINSLFYFCISITGKSLFSRLGLPESYNVNNLFSYFILIISLLYIIFTQWKFLVKILKDLTNKMNNI